MGGFLSLYSLVAEYGAHHIQELSDRWIAEAKHLDIGLSDFGTSLQDWDQVRVLVHSVIEEPGTQPNDPVVDDLVLYLNMEVTDGSGSTAPDS